MLSGSTFHSSKKIAESNQTYLSPPPPPPSPVIRYFIDSYQDLQDSVTVEMLYLQCRKAIEKGEMMTDEDTIFELASLVMQATHGQFTT